VRVGIISTAGLVLLLLILPIHAAEGPEDLWDAARKGDDKTVAALLDKGVDVNAKTRYGATALWFAAYKGHLKIVRLLVDRKAEVNVMDTVWGQTPLLMAAEDGKSEIIEVLLAAGAREAEAALLEATRQGKSEIVQILLDKGHVAADGMGAALLIADKPAVREILAKAGAKPLGKDAAAAAGDDLAAYVGNYQSPGGLSIQVQLKDGRLVTASGYGAFVLRSIGRGSFEAIGAETDLAFERQGERVVRMVVKRRGMEASLFGRTEAKVERKLAPGMTDDPAAVVARPGNWPSFRGESASGVALEGPQRAELVANGTNFIRGYDPFTGKELWRLGPNAEITVPTPIAGDGLIYVTSGYRPIQPIYAVWAGASGDLSLKEGTESNDQVAWSKRRGGPYMPTPILYRGYLYTCSNNGQVACYEARTGKQIYQERLGGTGGYSASPVAADGRLYFSSEEGKVSVVKAGPVFELLAVNQLDDACMATPAIADGRIIFRTQHYVVDISR
jgi:hypothetical protein